MDDYLYIKFRFSPVAKLRTWSNRLLLAVTMDDISTLIQSELLINAYLFMNSNKKKKNSG